MTNEEAIKWIEEHHDTTLNTQAAEAMRLAIKALKIDWEKIEEKAYWQGYNSGARDTKADYE